ncbi:MAG: hypothetical protein ACK478_06670 [Flavobacteriales bacterium]|jgi:hypothetical protein
MLTTPNHVVSDRVAPSLSKKSKPKLYYPSWKSVLTEVAEADKAKHPEQWVNQPLSHNATMAGLEVLREVLTTRNLELLFSTVPTFEGEYTASESLQTIMSRFKSAPIRPNEFYAVFDLHACRYLEMDSKLDTLLGFSPDDFNVPALMKNDAYTHIFHVRDHYHMLRWACLAQMMVASKMMVWRSLEDQFRIRFRVRTQKSTLAAYREHEYLTLEKLCFLYNEEHQGEVMPKLHIDKWLIFDRSEFEQVRPAWISTIERQSILNDALYLFNAALIDFPVQYLLYLQERSTADRNKAIAERLNGQIMAHSGIEAQLDEQQIADCMAKTIRPRIAQAVNLWEHRKPHDLCSVDSDLQAVEAARSLGLLPIPDRIRKVLYKNIMAF